MRENMWWETVQYSLNQLDLFNMKGLSFCNASPLSGVIILAKSTGGGGGSAVMQQ